GRCSCTAALGATVRPGWSAQSHNDSDPFKAAFGPIAPCALAIAGSAARLQSTSRARGASRGAGCTCLRTRSRARGIGVDRRVTGLLGLGGGRLGRGRAVSAGVADGDTRGAIGPRGRGRERRSRRAGAMVRLFVVASQYRTIVKLFVDPTK